MRHFSERIICFRSRVPTCARMMVLIFLSIIILGMGPNLSAGGIHIHYGPDAPEKLAAANLAFYEGALRFDHRHPIEFKHEFPFYTKLLSDSTLMNHFVARWEAHEQRFEYWGFPLWKVVDGYVLSRMSLPPGPHHRLPPRHSGTEYSGSGGIGNGGIDPQFVPEPSSGILSICGLVAGLLALTWRRASNRR